MGKVWYRELDTVVVCWEYFAFVFVLFFFTFSLVTILVWLRGSHPSCANHVVTSVSCSRSKLIPLTSWHLSRIFTKNISQLSISLCFIQSIWRIQKGYGFGISCHFALSFLISIVFSLSRVSENRHLLKCARCLYFCSIPTRTSILHAMCILHFFSMSIYFQLFFCLPLLFSNHTALPPRQQEPVEWRPLARCPLFPSSSWSEE